MRDLDGWMHKLARGAYDSDAHNFVFVMRKVLTEVWQDGFDAGHMAADHDRFTVSQVEKLVAEAKERADD